MSTNPISNLGSTSPSFDEFVNNLRLIEGRLNSPGTGQKSIDLIHIDISRESPSIMFFYSLIFSDQIKTTGQTT